MLNGSFPLVSVAVATCNQKPFLVECIESIRTQTYENLELVVGDDASEDGTQEYLQSLRNDPRFARVSIVAHATRVGITNNANSILANCRGKYIAWMGGDDLMLPRKVERQVEVLEKDPSVRMCFHNLILFDSDSGSPLRNYNDANTPRRGTWLDLVQRGTINGACSTMTCNLGASLKFNTRYPMASDWRFWIDLLLTSGGDFIYLDEILGKYRRHAKNVTSIHNPQYRQALLDHLVTIGDLWVRGDMPGDMLARRTGFLAFSMRHLTDDRLGYARCLCIALVLGPRLKAAIGLLTFLGTLGLAQL